MRWKYWKAWEKYLPDRETRKEITPNFEYWNAFNQFLPEEAIYKPACSFYWRAWEKYQEVENKDGTITLVRDDLIGKLKKAHA
ncbi:MAG: hypothetical protein LUQ38_07685 [Methanotrichaceae archaeon]|nr:hypothetical protein [Methanotrichaceae archaeon]